jgi:protein-S-isoprenylcysteine O-methyltransferase Ste14
MPDGFVERNAKLLSTLAVLVLILALAGLALTHSLLGRGPVSLGLQALALLLNLWARLTFGLRSFHYAANPTAGGLVNTGPYRYVRHPIYASILLIVWAGVAANPSLTACSLALLATAMLFLRMICEETLVRRTYPQYDDYARRTKRVVPFLL